MKHLTQDKYYWGQW